MKYENFKQVQVKVDLITKLQDVLDRISTTYTEIHVVDKFGGRIYTIGVYQESEHQYATNANKFLTEMRDDLGNRIDRLKNELSEL